MQVIMLILYCVTLSAGVLCRSEVTGVIESTPNEIKQSTDIVGPQQELVC